jgi:hypothetical protein
MKRTSAEANDDQHCGHVVIGRRVRRRGEVMACFLEWAVGAQAQWEARQARVTASVQASARVASSAQVAALGTVRASAWVQVTAQALAQVAASAQVSASATVRVAASVQAEPSGAVHR